MAEPDAGRSAEVVLGPGAVRVEALRPAGRGLSWLDPWIPWVFPAPALLTFAAVLGFPLGYVVWVSLHDWPLSPLLPAPFLGLGNYLTLLGTARFWHALGITFYFTALAVGGELVLGVAVALLLFREFRGRGLARTALLLPMAATPVALSLVWSMMMEPTLGILNYLLGRAGLPPSLWAADVRLAVPVLALVDVWFWTPFVALIVLAGLGTIPGEVLESARLDGAGAARLLRHVVLPLVRPHVVMAAILRVIPAVKTFDHIFVITGGGPLRASETLNLYTFLESFEFFHVGYASALAVTLMLIILGLTALLAAARRREWSY